MRVGLIVGHTDENFGAMNFKHMVKEYEYNSHLCEQLSLQMEIEGIVNKTFYKDGYQHDYFIDTINNENVDCFIEFHCNAFDKLTKGSETLHTENNKMSSVLANLLHENIIKNYDRIRKHNRGCKFIYADDRGYKNLINIKKPVALLEPFFLDNDYDFETFGLQKRDLYMQAIISALKTFYPTINE